MDKVISTRIDESAADMVGALARHLQTSKKRVLEEAIRSYAELVKLEKDKDPFELTSGAWARKESPAQLVREARKAFADSMARRQG